MPKAPLNPALRATFPPPVMEARAWLDTVTIPDNRPLLNVSQAAPVDPPPAVMLEAMAQSVQTDPGAHFYGPVLGMPELRAEIARQWTQAYGGPIAADEVAITSGCNQAFCASVMSVAGAGDAVILPTPWYFNHKMWLDMSGVEARLLPCGANMLPEVDKAEALITPAVKAIVLVTPNNPTGAEYPAGLVAEFAALARKHGLALIIDETYRDFDSREGAPHDLFRSEWQDVLIHLYSFSKVFRLTGHRIGALITARNRMVEIEKILDTITICPNQIGQRAALFGLRHMADWVAAERAEILSRRRVVEELVPVHLPDWKLLGSGAYFTFVEHPFDMPSDTLARRLVEDQSVLLLPGTMFAPSRAKGGDGSAERQLRIAFANSDAKGLEALIMRLAAFRP